MGAQKSCSLISQANQSRAANAAIQQREFAQLSSQGPCRVARFDTTVLNKQALRVRRLRRQPQQRFLSRDRLGLLLAPSLSLAHRLTVQ